MKIPKQVVETVEARSIQIHAKLRDSGHYTLMPEEGKQIAVLDGGYVPSWLPDGGGDYLELDIDLETGQILNWKKPSPEAVARTFNLLPFAEE